VYFLRLKIIYFITKFTMTLPRLLSPTVTVRLFDPMPLPKKSAAVRRARIVLRKKGGTPKLTFKVKKVPLQA